MTDTPQRVRVTVDGAVARLTLVNADRRNVVDQRFTEEFLAAARLCAADRRVAVILIAAEGEAFSVGGDVDEFVAQGPQIGVYVADLAGRFHSGIVALRQSPAAIVLALQGTAAGGGFSLVCGADLVVAARGARLCSAYTRSGLTPDGGGTWFLPRIVGARRAFELLAMNPTLTAEQGRELGLVSEVVDDAELTATVETRVRELARLAPGVLAGLTRLLRGSATAGLEEQLAAEAAQIAALAATPATRALLAAFLRRRG